MSDDHDDPENSLCSSSFGSSGSDTDRFDNNSDGNEKDVVEPFTSPLPVGTITSGIQVMLPNGQNQMYDCVKCNSKLQLILCPSFNCPLKKHFQQNEQRDAKYLQENCPKVNRPCFCGSFNDYNYFDVIGRCYNCSIDYHICPVNGCTKLISHSSILIDHSRDSLQSFNDHLRTHNDLKSRKTASKNKSKVIGNLSQSSSTASTLASSSITFASASAFSSSSSGNENNKRGRFDSNNASTSNPSDLNNFNFDDFDLNSDGIINTIPATSSHVNDILQRAKSYLLMPQPDIAQVLQLLNEAMLNNHQSNDGEDESISQSLLKIENELLSKDIDIDKILGKMSRIEIQIEDIHPDLDISKEIKEIKKSLLKNNDKIEAVRYLEQIRDKVESAEQNNKKRRTIVTVPVELDNSIVPLSSSPSPNQSMVMTAAEADGMSDNIQIGSIIFFLFYDIDRLYRNLLESNESIIPNKLPVQYINQDGKEVMYELDVMDYQMIIPLDERTEQSLLSQGIISEEESEWDEVAGVMFFSFNDITSQENGTEESLVDPIKDVFKYLLNITDINNNIENHQNRRIELLSIGVVEMIMNAMIKYKDNTDIQKYGSQLLINLISSNEDVFEALKQGIDIMISDLIVKLQGDNDNKTINDENVIVLRNLKEIQDILVKYEIDDPDRAYQERHHVPRKNSGRSYFNNFNVHINDVHFYPSLQKTLAESPSKKQKSEESSTSRKEPIIFAINSTIDPIPINDSDLLFANIAHQVANNNSELFATQTPDFETSSQFVMAVVLNDNNISNTLSANQDQLALGSYASSIGPNVGEGCIIFYFFYDSNGIKKLKERHMNKETRVLFENGIPIRYVGDFGDIIEKVLPVEHISIFALLTEKEKDELIKEDIIDSTPIRIHESTNIKLMRYKGISKMIQLPPDNEATISAEETPKVLEETPKVSEERSSFGRRGSGLLNFFRRPSSTSASSSRVKIAEERIRISGETEVLSRLQENPRIGNQKNTTSNTLEEAKNSSSISTKEAHVTSRKKDTGAKAADTLQQQSTDMGGTFAMASSSSTSSKSEDNSKEVRKLLQVISDFPYEIDFLRLSIKKIRELYQDNKELSNDAKLMEDVKNIIKKVIDETDDKIIQSNSKVILEIFAKESSSKPAAKETTAEIKLKIPGTKGAKDS